MAGKMENIQVLDFDNGQTCKVSIAVYAPTATLNGAHTSDNPAIRVGGVYGYNGNYLHFGSDPVAKTPKHLSPGYGYTGSITTPNLTDSAGSFAFVQLLNVDRTIVFNNHSLEAQTQGYELDTQFPYNSIEVSSNVETKVTLDAGFKDSPGIPVGVGITQVTVADKADDYFMYQPNGHNSIYVTLARHQWQWGAKASLPANKLNVASNWRVTPDALPPNAPAANSSELPSWIDNAKNPLQNYKPIP